MEDRLLEGRTWDCGGVGGGGGLGSSALIIWTSHSSLGVDFLPSPSRTEVDLSTKWPALGQGVGVNGSSSKIL